MEIAGKLADLLGTNFAGVVKWYIHPYTNAAVVKWYTRTVQSRVAARPCGFNSHPRHWCGRQAHSAYR